MSFSVRFSSIYGIKGTTAEIADARKAMDQLAVKKGLKRQKEKVVRNFPAL